MKTSKFFWNIETGVLQACFTGSFLSLCARYGGHTFKILHFPNLPSDISIALCGVGVTALDFTIEQLFKRYMGDFVSKFLAYTLSSVVVLVALHAKKIISLTVKDAVLILTITLLSRLIFSTFRDRIEELYSEKYSVEELHVEGVNIEQKSQEHSSKIQAGKKQQNISIPKIKIANHDHRVEAEIKTSNPNSRVGAKIQQFDNGNETSLTDHLFKTPLKSINNYFGPNKWVGFQKGDPHLNERAKQSIYQDISTRFDAQQFNSQEQKMISQLIYIIEFLEGTDSNSEEKQKNPFIKPAAIYENRKIEEFNKSPLPADRKEAVICDLIQYSKPTDADALIRELSKAGCFDSKMIKICIEAILSKGKPDSSTLMILLNQWKAICDKPQNGNKSTEISVNDKIVKDAYLVLYEREKNLDAMKNKLAIWLANHNDLQLETFKTFMTPFVQAVTAALQEYGQLQGLEWEVENVLLGRIRNKPEWQQELQSAADSASLELVRHLKYRKIIQ